MSNESQIYTKTTKKYSLNENAYHYIDIYEPSPSNPYATLSRHPVVVLVHGLAVSKEFFANFAVEFVKYGYIAICPELRGHGISTGELEGIGFQKENFKLGYPNLSEFRDEMANVLLYLHGRNDIDWNRISLVGHSMGGGAVLTFNLLWPHFFNSTVAIAPIPITGLNSTNIANLMIALGRYDEAFTFEQEWNLFLSTLPNSSQTNGIYSINTLYGSFSDGTARKFIYRPWDDHATEFVDPVIIKETIMWTANSQQWNPILDTALENNGDIPLLFDERVLFIQSLIICSFLILLVSGGIIVESSSYKKLYKKESNNKEMAANDVSRKTSSLLPLFMKTPSVSPLLIIMVHFITGAVIGIGFFLLFYFTGYLITAAIVGPIVGYFFSLCLISKRRFKEYFVQSSNDAPFRLKDFIIKFLFFEKPPSRSRFVKETFASLAIASVFLILFELSAGSFFINYIPSLARSGGFILFSMLLFIVMIGDGFLFYYPSGSLDTLVSDGKKTISSSLKTLWVLIKKELLHLLIQVPPIVLAISLELLFIDNRFPLMFVPLVVGGLLIMDFIKVSWARAGRSNYMSSLTLSLIYSSILVALSPIIAI